VDPDRAGGASVTSEPANLLADLEFRRQFEELLADVAARFLEVPAHELDAEIRMAQRRLCDLLEVDRSTLWWMPGPDSHTLALLSVVAPEELPPPPTRMDARDFFPYTVAELLDGRPVYLTRLTQLPAHAGRDLESHRHFGTKSSAIIPLRSHGRVVGAVAFAATRAERDWPEPVVRRLELAAQILASALHRRAADAELRAVSGRLIHAQEKERTRLAQDLHDGLCQDLAVLSVELDLLAQRPLATAAETSVHLTDLSARTKALSADAHRLSHGLHPAKLKQLGLAAALRGFCRDVQATARVQVTYSADDVPMLSADVALVLYRVAQEAVGNAIKHSGARHVAVELAGAASVIRLAITDDGCGFDPAAASLTGSLGLLGMRERVGMVGGRIRWEPTPGGGTTVRVEVPPSRQVPE